MSHATPVSSWPMQVSNLHYRRDKRNVQQGSDLKKQADACRKTIIQEFSTLKATPTESTNNQQSSLER